MDSFRDPVSWHSIPFAKCSSADISDAEGPNVRELWVGRTVPAESLVPTDAGALPRRSRGDEVRLRPLGASSDRRLESADGLLALRFG